MFELTRTTFSVMFSIVKSMTGGTTCSFVSDAHLRRVLSLTAPVGPLLIVTVVEDMAFDTISAEVDIMIMRWSLNEFVGLTQQFISFIACLKHQSRQHSTCSLYYLAFRWLAVWITPHGTYCLEPSGVGFADKDHLVRTDGSAFPGWADIKVTSTGTKFQVQHGSRSSVGPLWISESPSKHTNSLT